MPNALLEVSPNELRNYDPTLRERIGAGVANALYSLGLGGDKRESFRHSNRLMDVIGAVPIVGDALDAYDAGREIGGGNLIKGAAVLGASMLPGVSAKGAGEAARRISSSFDLDYFGTPIKVMQNPSQKRLLGFMARTKHKAVRQLTDPETGDVFVWDAGDPALHQLVAEQLGMKYSPDMGDTLFLD